MNCFEEIMKKSEFRRSETDFLLLYLHEDGAYCRRVSANGTRRDEVLLREVREETLFEVLEEILRKYRDAFPLLSRSLSVVYTLSKKVEILNGLVREYFRKRPETDSVERLYRGELFYRAANALSSDMPRQILFCGARETALYTAYGEVPIGKGITGGNGFEDYVLSFIENEEDTAASFFSQINRATELFRTYRCFSLPEEEDTPRVPEERGGLKPKPPSEDDGDDIHAPALVYCRTLPQSVRARIDRKPVFYRASRDRFYRRRFVTLSEAVKRYEECFGEIRNAGGNVLDDLIVTGKYATFPLTMDFLRALPEKPTITYVPEEKLVLFGMETAISARLGGARFLLTGLYGEEILLWDADGKSGTYGTEKRVSLPVLLKRRLTEEERAAGEGTLPFTMAYPGVRQSADGEITCETVVKKGDLFRYCYEKCEDGTYRLFGSAGYEDAYLTATLGISATATGIVCHVLSLNHAEALSNEK